MSKRLEGKTALVTGAGSGIGSASARLFAREGANVLAFDLTEGVEGTARLVVEEGNSCMSMRGDAGDEADIDAAVRKALDEFGTLHVVFANAGITGGVRGGFFDASPDDWAEVLRVNLIGPFLAVKHGAPAIRDSGGGAIVCTASVAGMRSGANIRQARQA